MRKNSLNWSFSFTHILASSVLTSSLLKVTLPSGHPNLPTLTGPHQLTVLVPVISHPFFFPSSFPLALSNFSQRDPQPPRILPEQPNFFKELAIFTVSNSSLNLPKSVASWFTNSLTVFLPRSPMTYLLLDSVEQPSLAHPTQPHEQSPPPNPHPT